MRPYLLALLLATTLQAQTAADDQKHWAEITHKLEAAPLDEDTVHDARFAVAEIATAHDFHIPVCFEIYNDFGSSKYEYHDQIRYLYLLGGATYRIETGKTDLEGTNLYALHSVLKGYAAILKNEPNATDKTLDSFAKADAKGKLPDLIAKKACKPITS